MTDYMVEKALAYRVEEDNRKTLEKIKAMLDHEPRIKAAHRTLAEHKDLIDKLETYNGQLKLAVDALSERVDKMAAWAAKQGKKDEVSN